MTLASRLALGAALAVATMSAPVLAQKGKEAPAAAAAALKLGKAFREAAGPAQAAIKAKNAAEAIAKLTAADAVAVTPDEKYIAAQLRLQIGSFTNDTAMQAKAVEAMIASGSPATAIDLPKLNFYAGDFAYKAGDFPKAVQYLQAAERAGYTDNGNVFLLLAEANIKSNQIPGALAYIEKAIGAQTAAGKVAPQSWYMRAASVALKAKMMPEAGRWTRELARHYPTVDNWRSALVIYRDSSQREGQQLLDIFRLMRQTKSLAGERDYFEFAALASERGLPGEAKAVIDEGLESKTIPANSRAITELRALVSGKVAADQASLAASERQAGAAANGRLAANTADAYLGYGSDAKAIALYKMALAKGSVDVDAVNLRLGIALGRSGDKAGARQAFQSVKGPRAEIAAFWLLWLDQAA